jgi:ribosomal-protein-alanine N-acetyltransferase
MFWNRKLSLRPAAVGDRNAIFSLTRYEKRVHAHLDWKPIEDWLGAQPFILAERGQRLVAALAAPPDPPDTAWVRLFALADRESTDELWPMLWSEARLFLERQGVHGAAGLSIDGWMDPLYARAGFQPTHAVIVLARDVHAPISSPPGAPAARIRPARPTDHDAIIATDTAAFAPPWQMSGPVLRTAFAQAGWLTVAEVDDVIVGYQLSTPSPEGAHLARLAVLPDCQGRGIGAGLVVDLIAHYVERGARVLTVNTQDTNAASLAVYQRFGFKPNGARFPVFQLPLG